MGRKEPIDVLLVAHCPFARRNVVAVLMPFSDLIELYQWEFSVVLLTTCVGLFELHPAACDSVSNVRFHIVVEVLELVNEVLRVVFVAFVRYGFVFSGIGVAAVRFWAHAKVPRGFGTLWLEAHLAGTTVLLVVVIRGLVIFDGFCELKVAALLGLSGSLECASNGNWDSLSI